VNHIRAGIQAALDECDSGFQVCHWVVIVGCERIDADGDLEVATSMFSDPMQASYITDGLLMKAHDLQAISEEPEP
jgi:hypothetical protein